MKWVKRNTIRQYEHARMMPEKRLVRKVYQSSAPIVAGRSRPAISWDGTVVQYKSERVGGGSTRIEEGKSITFG